MGFINEYPSTDFHELNLDWIINTVIELQKRVNDIKTEFLLEANQYTDEQIADKIGAIQSDVNAFKIEVNNSLSEFGSEIETFKNVINAQITIMNAQLELFARRIDTAVKEANNYTILAIQSNNEYIIEEVKKGVAVEVINPASGEKQSIQDAINYLFSLHTNNSITYDELVDRAITYDTLAALNITYEQLAINGKILIPRR